MPNPSVTDRSLSAERGDDILQAVGATRTTIDWQRSMPWWFFLSGFVRLGWRLSHVLFATVGVWLSLLGWRLAAGLLTIPQGSATANSVYPTIWSVSSGLGLNLFQVLGNITWKFDLRGLAALALLFVWLVLVWGVVGGVICRRSVVELGARTTIGWTSAFKLVFSRLRAIFEAAGLPALAAISLCAIPFLLGLLGRFGAIGEVLASVGVLSTFLIAIPIAWLLLLLVFGFPLMTAAIVTEKDSDAFDGLSRSAAYLFQRPVTILIAVVLSATIISLFTSIVATIYAASVWAFTAAYAAGAGLENFGQFRTGFANGTWQFVQVIFGLIIYGVAASLFWSATAATYLIVRREVDHTDYDELDLQETGSPLALPSSNYDQAGILEIGRQEEAARTAKNANIANDSVGNQPPTSQSQAVENLTQPEVTPDVTTSTPHYEHDKATNSSSLSSIAENQETSQSPGFDSATKTE